MIVAIDGTGPESPGDYAKEMGGSFCSQIGRTANALYFRGPTLTGSETSAIANLAVDAVIAARNKASTGKVMLAGYSRGGCAAIIAARRLKDRGVGVDSLFLFDAVDMQTSECISRRSFRIMCAWLLTPAAREIFPFGSEIRPNRDSISIIPGVISRGREATTPNRSLAATARWAAFPGRTLRRTPGASLRWRSG
jgi:thioesterase domain-containing protein